MIKIYEIPKFVKGDYRGFVGYSERLSFILKEKRDATYFIAPMPFGATTNTLLYSDVLVIRKGVNSEVRKAAHRFIQYINDAATFEWIMMADDVPGKPVPRYLLSAIQSVYQNPRIESDRYYRQLYSKIKLSKAMPNSGLPLLRKDVQNRFKQPQGSQTE